MHSSGALICVTAVQGIPPDCLALLASGAYTFSPTGLYALAFVKGKCLKVWLPVRLNIDAC